MSFETPSSSMKSSGAAPQTPHTSSASSYNQLKDFSVESQRRMFIQEQERERQAAEFRKSSRKILKASLSGSASGASSSVMISGLMSQLESGKGGFEPKTRVGDDDDDSIADDWSLDSEESFYVGIERADYTQPNNLEMYGTEDTEPELKEDRLGISRVSAAILKSEKGSDQSTIFMHDEKNSSLHDFMIGNNNAKATGQATKNIVVIKPIEIVGIDYRGKSTLDSDDAPSAQVYQQEAAEGKMFINKLIEDSEPGTSENIVSVHAITPAKKQNTIKGTTFTTPGARTVGTNASVTVTGHYPVLSPMTLFSPLATGGKGIKGEDNALRQMREREIRKDASEEANATLAEKVKEIQKFLADAVEEEGGDGKVDAAELARQLETIMSVGGAH